MILAPLHPRLSHPEFYQSEFGTHNPLSLPSLLVSEILGWVVRL